MSLVPAFEIGIWNAWIFMIWLLIQNFGVMLVSKDIYYKAGEPPDMKPSRKYKILSYILTPLWLLATTYSFFLPFKLGTIWFIMGLIIFSLGLIINIIASINFVKTPINEPVSGGAYRYSRNPIYIALVLIFLGVSIASASWIFLLLTVLMAILVSLSIADEERYCLDKYGDTYREYMARTPRWIGIPK